MKKKIILIISILLLVCCAILIYLTATIDPISLKQAVFTYSQNELIPDQTENYVIGSYNTLEKAKLDISSVAPETIGIYDCSISYRNKTYAFQIQIKDNNPPIAELIKVKWEIKVGYTLKASDMVTNVQENSNYQVYFDGKEPVLERTFDVPGTYNDIYLFVEDQFGNQSERLRVSVSVGSDQIAPLLNGVDDKAIYVGSYFDPLSGVSAIDNLDGDITKKIIVIGEVNPSVKGEYQLIYTVKDQAGNITKYVRTIKVTDQYFDPSLVPDVGNGLFISKQQSNTRFNYFTTINRSKITMKDANEQIDTILNYLIDSSVYVNRDNEEYSTSYSVIVDKAGNAKGFASAFKYMCDQLEIPCYYVNGLEDSTSDAWNVIYYEGNFYHINVTALFKKPEKYFWSDVEMEQKGYKFDKINLPKCGNIYKGEE